MRRLALLQEHTVGHYRRHQVSTEQDEKVDQYGNPVDGSEIRNCCFPDCGCDGARNCMAGGRPNRAAAALNSERGSSASFGKEFND